jgi:Zn-dependent M28 family amino/carboxypeptidase
LSVLAADSLRGRGTATPGAAKAARLIAEAMHEMGLQPAGDSGYYQRVPLFRTASGLALADSLQGAEFTDVNVVGILPGADSARRGEAVIVGAHYDHLGVGTPVGGDSIYNGADDDGSGVIATLAIARALAAGPPPGRTLIFLLTTGEEVGLLGTNWYVAHPVVSLASTVADLQIEMIGRPDPLVGGVGVSWLTGYERSTVGNMIKQAGLPIAPDPRPIQRFFERSDNIVFARLGIPAHTLSSYGMHPDYHTPRDEVAGIDFVHMARVVDAGARLVRLLADGPKPEWHPGGKPE